MYYQPPNMNINFTARLEGDPTAPNIYMVTFVSADGDGDPFTVHYRARDEAHLDKILRAEWEEDADGSFSNIEFGDIQRELIGTVA